MNETREQEANRIARAEGYEILSHDEDWTFFTLDDGQVIPVEQDGSMLRYLLAGRTIRTHFEWVEGRFEGFVS